MRLCLVILPILVFLISRTTWTITIQTPTIHVTAPRPDKPATKTIANPTQTAEKTTALSGVTLREYSGPGSTQTISLPATLQSSESTLFIDGIHIAAPTGTGFDISLLPLSGVSGANYRSPLFATRTSFGETDFQLGTTPKALAALKTGSGLTAQTDILHATQNTLVSAHFLQTQGRYGFTDPRNGQASTRENNEAIQGSALAKISGKTTNDLNWSIIPWFAAEKRTNPGSLEFPLFSTQQQGFGFLGGKLQQGDTTATMTLQASELKVANDLTKTRSAQAGLTYSILSANIHWQSLSITTPLARTGIQSAARWQWLLDDIAFSPFLRIDKVTSFNPAVDGGITAFTENWWLGYGYLHAVPDLQSLYGMPGAFRLMPNPELALERDHIVNLGFAIKEKTNRLTVETIGRIVRERAQFVSLSADTGQMQSIARAWLINISATGETALTPWLVGRLNASISSGKNQVNNRQLPYIPLLRGHAELEIKKDSSRLSLKTEQTSSCYSDTENARSIEGWWLTDVKLSTTLSGGTVSFEARNLFNTAGYMSEGFPLIGRTLWLGYSHEWL